MAILLALTLTLSTAAQSPVDASQLTFSVPSAIVELDSKKLKGDLYRLTWSPDAQHVYLQAIERDKTGNIAAAHHYLLALDGKPPKATEEEPGWSATYWMWKSGQAAPGSPTLKIDVEQQRKRINSTSIPMGGDLARGGAEGGTTSAGSAAGTGTGDAMAAAVQSQLVNVYILKLKGEVVGEFINAPAIPGLTFGWAPAGTGLIAFVDKDGRLVIMDGQGRKHEVPSSKAALLPAWTGDGKRIAYLERSGKNKATLKIVDVTQPAR